MTILIALVAAILVIGVLGAASVLTAHHVEGRRFESALARLGSSSLDAFAGREG